jgi:hypothetical protein
MGLKGLKIRLENRRTMAKLNALKWQILDDDRRARGLPPIPDHEKYQYQPLIPDRVLYPLTAVGLIVVWWMGLFPWQH